MGIVNALQNGTKQAIASNANVNINLGNGNSVINVTAKNANINTGCGNQNITAVVSNNLTIDTGYCGEDVINAVVGGNASITTREDDDFINLYVDGNFNVNSGMNHPACGATEDDDVVLIHGNLDNTKGKNFVSTGEGTDNVRIIANNVNVCKGDGNLALGFYGDNYNVNSNADNNLIGFWGDNVNININGQGQQDVKTLDFSFEEGRFLDFGFQDLLEQETYAGSSVDTIVTERLTGKDNLDEVGKKYNLTDDQIAKLRELDLEKKTSNGQPYYLLYKQGDKYEIGYRTANNQVYTLDGKLVTTRSSRTTSTGSSYVTVTTTTTSNNLTGVADLDVEREREIKTETIKTDYYDIDGVKNVNINFNNNGKYNVGITSSDGYVNINGKNACNNDIYQNILVRSGYVVTDQTKDTDIQYVMDKLSLSAGNITKSVTSSSYSYWAYDPLVLDTNKDGVINTYKHGNYGVDINGDGQGNGAAVNGDKMLAMSDLNNNGKIDGSEVFGNYTISPFTKKAINASNGFEALKAIAIEAEQYTGITCINGNSIDIKKLSEALARYGVKLGLIGDNNTSKLEALGDIATINTGYKNVSDYGEQVQHSQIGYYTSADGSRYMAHDINY